MKKYVLISMLVIFIPLFSNSLKDEMNLITTDRKMITDLEKVLLNDERGCETPSENLDKSVILELKIYCSARFSARNRLPELKKMISDYENAVKNYWANCKIVESDEQVILCESLDNKVVNAAKWVNDEKEALRKDLNQMENAAKKAADMNNQKNDWTKKENNQNISDDLRIKKETVITMKKGLIDDSVLLEKSKLKLNYALSNGSKELQLKTASLLKGVKNLININIDLRDLCLSMTRSIDSANHACIIKQSETGCTETGKKLKTIFAEGNSKLKKYTSEKERLVKEESELHKASLSEITVIMENANRQISSYLKNIQMQNDQLKQRIELSKKDIEVLQTIENKSFIHTYLTYVETMKSLEKESSEYVLFFSESITEISEFIKNCTLNKGEYSTECRLQGDKIVKEIEETIQKATRYGAKYNRLNSDLAAFAKKVSEK